MFINIFLAGGGGFSFCRVFKGSSVVGSYCSRVFGIERLGVGG